MQIVLTRSSVSHITLLIRCIGVHYLKQLKRSLPTVQWVGWSAAFVHLYIQGVG